MKKVIIRGHVFDYSEKAPFVRSGVSVLGALEYSPVSDTVRCHECGFESQYLSTHIIRHHKMSVADYKVRHGLCLTSSVCTPNLKAKYSVRAKTANVSGLKSRRGLTGLKRSPSPSAERRNISGSCQAQTLYRIQLLAAHVGRTPTQAEMTAAKLDCALLRLHFGTVEEAIKLAGLESRKRWMHDVNGTCPLPKGFPTKAQLVEARMPWPKEYFGVRESRSSALRASVNARSPRRRKAA